MAKITVTVDHPELQKTAVLLEESVQPVHLSTAHAAAQLVERLGWALRDAEELEHGPARRD